MFLGKADKRAHARQLAWLRLRLRLRLRLIDSVIRGILGDVFREGGGRAGTRTAARVLPLPTRGVVGGWNYWVRFSLIASP